jgi:GTP-binding protein EngB required for normal cell division
MNSGAQKPRESLNPYQANRLRITCQYIDKLLVETEGILNTSVSKAAFPRYLNDILPAQRRTIEDYIARVRAQLVRVINGQGIPREKPFIPASRAIHVNLGGIDIAVEELKPKYMRGYGEVPPWVATELNGIVGELAGLVQRFDRYLSEGSGEDLKSRLARLERAGNDLAILEKIEETVRDRGLVEFRPSIAAILDRAEDKSFEIAMFGRVSAGKSSLLNAILETDILPVGVTPITAVPTRIIHADEPTLTVWFSEAPRKILEISHLQEFATEQQNPGNAKHVVRLVLSLPSPRLRTGVSFVDTPGLGSLASSGAKETMAYLPKCDLGVVLIDAGSTLTADDVHTILTLQEAAIPVHVLVSKADLISPEDRVRIVQYVKDHISNECKLDVTVHPVSVLPSCREMLNQWFESQIIPLYARSNELRGASLRRKIGLLRDSVGASLQARLRRGAYSSTKSKEKAQAAEELLRRTTGKIEEIRSLCIRFAETASEEAAGGNASEAIKEASRRLIHSWKTSSYGVVVPGQLVRDSMAQFVDMQARKLQTEIKNLAVHLETNLRECAADLGLSDVPGDGEFESLIREMSAFESPSYPMAVSRPTIIKLFGDRVTQRLVAKKITSQLRPTFYSALEIHWRLFGEWSASVIAQLKQRYETYAENYRAQAEQALGGRQLSKDERTGLEESLAQLAPDVMAECGLQVVNSPRDISMPQEQEV